MCTQMSVGNPRLRVFLLLIKRKQTEMTFFICNKGKEAKTDFTFHSKMGLLYD
jgi:hypothetical protein